MTATGRAMEKIMTPMDMPIKDTMSEAFPRRLAEQGSCLDWLDATAAEEMSIVNLKLVKIGQTSATMKH